MSRLIVAAPDLSGTPLTELKQWLAISGAQEDALLQRLLAAAHETCERFTGLVALATRFEEQRNIPCDWAALATRPVTAVTKLERLSIDGTRTPLAAQDYEITIAGDGSAQLRLLGSSPDKRMIVTIDAGLAPTWSALPPALRDGMIRLAAHAYRGRDRAIETVPPAAVAALWRPYRRLLL